MIRCRINLEFVTLRRSVSAKSLTEDAVVTAARILVVTLPGDNKVAVLQCCYRGLTLSLVGLGVNLELSPQKRTASAMDLPVNPRTRAVLFTA